MNEQDEQSYDEGDEGSKSDDSISDHSNAVHSVLQLCRGQALQPPSDIAKGPNEAPRQPKIKFSLRSFGKGRKRDFNSLWYRSYTWLDYSISLDAAFCYPCRIFKCDVGSGRAEHSFIVTGFSNWKNAIGKMGIISHHNDCQSHRQAVVS